MDIARPPSQKDYPRDRLFRELIRRPKPFVDLKTRIRGAEHIPLRVVGMKSLDVSDAQASGMDMECSLIAQCVHVGWTRAFPTVEHVELLSSGEIAKLSAEVQGAVWKISPTYKISDLAAWTMALKEGAVCPGNLHESVTIFRSAQRVGMSGTPVYDMPSYYGIPYSELTDGQIMAYSAAFESISAMVRSTDG